MFFPGKFTIEFEEDTQKPKNPGENFGNRVEICF